MVIETSFILESFFREINIWNLKDGSLVRLLILKKAHNAISHLILIIK